ncbi:MAG TPA: thioesterase domain-containing protein [Streptosporangiaceae bacterium]|nr:thioesterase domain-containing protein [Streptosporangiaceae bacterium]
MNRWIQREALPGAVARTVCIPRAGGSARDFDSWRAPLGSQVELCAVQLPGRLDRYTEPALSDLGEIAAAVAGAVRGLAPLPFVLFGDCMGALVAFETARALRRTGDALPSALAVSSYPAPDRVRTERTYADGTAEDFRRRLQDVGGVPAAAIHDDELFELMLPTLRADFAAFEGYVCQQDEPLDVDIHALLGRTDPYYSASDMAGWQDHTSREFRLTRFDGGHFFLREGDTAASFVRELAMAVQEADSARP